MQLLRVDFLICDKLFLALLLRRQFCRALGHTGIKLSAIFIEKLHGVHANILVG